MPFKLGSNLRVQRKRPLDKLIWKNSKPGTYQSKSTRSTSMRILVFTMLASMFMFAGNRSARMYELAKNYTSNVMYRKISLPTVTTTQPTEIKPATIHDPHNGEESTASIEDTPEDPVKEDESGTEHTDSSTEESGSEQTESNAEEGAESDPVQDNEPENAVDAAPKIAPALEEKAQVSNESAENNSYQEVSGDVETAVKAAKELEPRGIETPAKGIYLEDAPLHAVNPAGKNFDIYDIDNPTKVERPEHGFPPRSLPENHPNYDILRTLRAKTELSPRWPNHPEVHLAALKSYGPAYASIIISDKLKVVYVPVFKVGTTSMMWNMAYLENNPAIVGQNISDAGIRDYILHDFNSNAWADHAIYGLTSDRIRATMNNPAYLKFGFVRNPYHRVVSAYLDKVVNWRIDSNEYQGQMYGLYGNDIAMRKFRNQTKPTFKEYLTAIEKVIASPRTKVQSLTHKDGYEDNLSRREIHFRPQVELLHPDLIHFDFIGRFDNIKNDTKEVLQWMYRHTDRRMPERRKMHSTDPKDKISLFEQLREDNEMRDTLLRIYKDDFERFGFSKEIPDPIEHKE